MKYLFVILALFFLPIPSMAGSDRLEMVGKDVVIDIHTKLMWQYGKSRRSFKNEADAVKYANELHLGGYDDWRLPTLAERWDIVQIYMYKNNGDIDFPKPDTRYWTRETDKGTTAIKLDFGCMCRGDQEVEYKTKGYVRAVRGPSMVDTEGK